MFPDLTLAMQKLYQTFVAQAAQLQSVHENVKVGFLPSASNIMLKVSLIRAVWLGIYNIYMIIWSDCCQNADSKQIVIAAKKVQLLNMC